MAVNGASNGGSPSEAARPEVAIVGGGIAGLEAILALRHLAGDRVSVTLVSPRSDFVYRPMAVEEPFSLAPAERHDLVAIADELGARFVNAPLAAVDPDRRRLLLDGDGALAYDAAVLCTGARPRRPFAGATMLTGPGEVPAINDVLMRAAAHPTRRLAFIVPQGVSWPLPAYELALMSARRARELGLDDLELVVVTPEAGPLIMFGPIASHQVYELLRARGVSVLPATYASDAGDGEGIVLFPGGTPLDAGGAVALPILEGPAIAGLPDDGSGFIPIDDHARVAGCEGLYAAGDATTFPIKQGGIATQQADAAAAQIAADAGCLTDPEPFHPILRGKLIVGDESLHLRADAGGGGGEGVASEDCLWWPSLKVAGRYLAPWLAGEGPGAELRPPRHPLEVEVALPREWHREPIALDPYASLGRD